MSSTSNSSALSPGAILSLTAGVIFVKVIIVVLVCTKRADARSETLTQDERFLTLTMNKFLSDMEREKPIRNLRALVYEYMGNGSLDKLLFCENKILDFTRLHEIAVGTARGIAYLHEDCQQRIVHYDIKPGNILLDANFSPKVADFGLAKLCNRENTHISMTGGRGTPGYAAPELWMPFPITHKCDVYSFGMLLFETVGRRRNVDNSLPDSESLEWFPKTVWKMFECGEMGDLINECGIEEKDREVAERMFKVALLCVQERPQMRPFMGVVVKMLEGALEIPTPSNPFQYLMSRIPGPIIPRQSPPTSSFSSSDSSLMPYSSFVRGTPIMTRYEIEIASSA